MDKESMLQAAEEEWLHAYHLNEKGYYWPEDELAMPWFWLILAESIWPEPEYVSLGFVPLEYAQWLKEQDEREEMGE